MGIVSTTVVVLGVTGVIAAILLYVVAKRFHVYENPKIGEIEELLPGANCGSCGYSGCHAFATACASADSMDGLHCPGAGKVNMERIAEIAGLVAVAKTPQVAVVRCDGTCDKRDVINDYDGVKSCAVVASLYGGETACVYGCLGCGDCVAACPYDSIHLNPDTGIPEVDFSKCVGCGRCVDACPRNIIELCDKHEDRPVVYVACMNRDKGAVAMKECQVSCIGCGRCKKVCPSQAVTVADFLAHIDSTQCISCGACVEACPRKSIMTCGITVEAETAQS